MAALRVPWQNAQADRRMKQDPAHGTVVGLLVQLAATTFLLGVLLLWAWTYEQNCLALVSPGLIYVAVFWGLLQYRLERRRFAIDYYLDGNSPWRRRLRRAWLPVAIGMIAALPLAVFLAAFAALGNHTDWLFLTGAAVLAPLLFNRVSVWPGRHFRGAASGAAPTAPAGVLTSRVAGHVLLALVVIAYVTVNASTFTVPAFINPSFPELSVEAFAAPVRSDCALVETGLRAGAAFDGVGWFLMTTAGSEPWATEALMVVAWAAFFLNAALAMTGLVRGLEGVMLVTARFASVVRAPAKTGRGVASNPRRWATGVGRAALLLIPLAVLTGALTHVLQQRAVERWSAELLRVDSAETRRIIEDAVAQAFAPAYAAVPEIVENSVSLAGLWDQVRSAFGEDASPAAELRSKVINAREAAAKSVHRTLRERDLARLVGLFNQDVAALPPWLRGAYEWALEPVHSKARGRLAEAVASDPTAMLGEMQREADAADIATRAWDRLMWNLASAVGSDRYREHVQLRRESVEQRVTEFLDEEKALATEHLSRAVGKLPEPKGIDP